MKCLMFHFLYLSYFSFHIQYNIKKKDFSFALCKKKQNMDSVFSDPKYRAFSHQSASDELLSTYIQQQSVDNIVDVKIFAMFQNIGVWDYLDIFKRMPLCTGFIKNDAQIPCSRAKSCVGKLDDPVELENKAKEWVRCMIQMGRRTNPYFCCHSCGISLVAFNAKRLAHDQHISTFKFLWKNVDSCHTPFNVHSIVCRACFLIWTICNYNFGKFATLQKRLFRPVLFHADYEWCQPAQNQSIELKNIEDRMTYTNRIDMGKMSSASGAKGSKKQMYGDLSTFRAIWALQSGLVCYTIPSETAMNQVNLPEWRQQLAMCTQLFNKKWDHLLIEENSSSSIYDNSNSKKKNNTVSIQFSDDMEENKKIEIASKKYSSKRTDTAVVASVEEKKLLNVNKADEKNRIRNDKFAKIHPYRFLYYPETFVVFWIPIDPSALSHSLWSYRLTARDRRVPCGATNYLLTIDLFHQLEQHFDYAQFIGWLMSVSYWNVAQSPPESMLKSLEEFALLRFKQWDPNALKAAKSLRWLEFNPALKLYSYSLQNAKNQNNSNQNKYVKIDVMAAIQYHQQISGNNNFWFLPQMKQHPQSALTTKVLVNNNKSASHQSKFSIPHIDLHKTNEELSAYVKIQIEKLSLLCSDIYNVQEIKSMYEISMKIIQFIKMKMDIIKKKDEYISYYNQHIQPKQKELSIMKKKKQANDQIIQPALWRLQRYRLDEPVLKCFGLDVEEMVVPQRVSKFLDLSQTEQVAVIGEFCESFRQLDQNQLIQLTSDLQKSKYIKQFLPPVQTHTESLSVCHGMFQLEKSNALKKNTLHHSNERPSSEEMKQQEGKNQNSNSNLKKAKKTHQKLQDLDDSWLFAVLTQQ